MDISNKEALKDKIHEIHNFLRNNGAGYGMNALKVFNILYGLKKITDGNLRKKVNLSDKCDFNHLLSLANSGQDEKLCSLIINDILDELHNNKILKNFLFYEIPRNMKSNVFSHLFKEIDNITIIEKSFNVQLSGKIYEYFIGRDQTAISELGAYFTDRHIVNYIYDILSIECNNGKIPTMIDMFGGSGGFTTGYVNYMKENYSIDWSSNINQIHHYDANEDVIKSAALELFCLTGELPNMNNLQYKNSFTDEFNNEKYELIITNPPYGGDKSSKSDAQIKRDKIKSFIKEDLKLLLKYNDICQKAKDNYEIFHKLEKGSSSLLTIEKSSAGILGWANESNSDLNLSNININNHNDIIKYRKLQLKNIENEEKLDKKAKNKNKVTIENSSQRIKNFAKNNKLKGNDKESVSLIQLMEMSAPNGKVVGVLKEGVFFNKTYKDIRKYLLQNFNVKKIISIPKDQFENTSTKTSIIYFENTEEKTSKIEFYELNIETFNEDKFIELNNNIILSENQGDIKCVNDNLISIASINDILNNENYSLIGKDYINNKINPNINYHSVNINTICSFRLGDNINKKDIISGKYPVYGGGKDIIGYHNDFNADNCIIIASVGSCGYVNISNDKCWATSNSMIIKSDDININNYLKYYLKSQENNIMKLSKGTAQQYIKPNQFNDYYISIPNDEFTMIEWSNKFNKLYDTISDLKNHKIDTEVIITSKIKSFINNNNNYNEKLISELFTLHNSKHYTNIGKKEGKYRFYNSSQKSKLYVDFYEFSDLCIILGQGGEFNIHIDKYFTPSKHVCVLKPIQMNDILLNYIYYYIPIIKDSLNVNGSIMNWLNNENIRKINIKIPNDISFLNELNKYFILINDLNININKYKDLYDKSLIDLKNESTINS
jgi:type I restriction-modification system DNA methylase subunit/restriction endonuclease S subunit